MTPLAKKLVYWYRKNRISYPWRMTRDPYKIWLSEILLQQTRIPVVLKFYEKILNAFPDLISLSKAKDAEFLSLWSGLGYYRRAQSMLHCAREIVQNGAGVFPSDLHELLALPGIGKYTAGAIRNVCYEYLTPAIDGNIRRVLARLAMSHEKLESVFLEVGKGAESGDFFQSLMELGEQICLPNPRCVSCPVQNFCKSRKEHRELEFPVKKSKQKSEKFHWYLLLLERKGAHFYAQNSAREFLKHSWIFPDVLSQKNLSPSELCKNFAQSWGIKVRGLKELRTLSHAVTYRKIHAHVLAAESFHVNGVRGKWLKPEDLKNYPTSSITRKSLQVQDR